MSPLLLAVGLAHGSAGPLSPGRYGLVIDTATVQKLPFVGRTKGGSRGWLLVDVEQTPRGLEQRMRTCDVIVTGMRGNEGRVEVPDAFVAAIPVNRQPVTVTPSADGSWTYSVDLGEDTIGWDPSLTDTMPTTADAPALLDFEGDGAPGATMRLKLPVFGTVDLHVVQHAHIALVGALEPDGSARGQVTYHRLDQATVGATNAMFTATPEMWPDPSRSGFALEPLADTVSCADLRAVMCALGEGC